MATVSKKLFVQVAAQFSAEFDVARRDPSVDRRDARLGTLRVMAMRMADVFSVENPNFKRDRFLTACGATN